MSAALKTERAVKSRAGRGQLIIATHRGHAPADSFVDHYGTVTHRQDVHDGCGINPAADHSPQGGEAGRAACVTHNNPASLEESFREEGGATMESLTPIEVVSLPQTIATIQSLHREHRGLQRAVTAMTLRIKADERWVAAGRIRREGGVLDGLKFPKPTEADKLVVRVTRLRYFEGRESLEALRRACEKELLFFAKQLPVAPWVTTVRGFALPSLAAIVGEAGDLGLYANPAKLWKRFSLHVINGHAARLVKGDATQQFVPVRRAEMHVVGDNLVRSGGPYADLYRGRKAYEIAKLADLGITVRPAARIPKADREKFMSDGQVHKRALRYIEKRLLRELWRAWGEGGRVSAVTHMDAATLSPPDSANLNRT